MNNVYGTKKPANISSDDIDIFYHYRPSRSTDSPLFDGFKQLNSNILTKVNYINSSDNSERLLSGMYNLRLPINEFKESGIYTIYIKPKEIETQILDVSTLAAFPNIRGIVLRVNGDKLSTNGALVGYRVEYVDNNERNEDFRIITSSNRCEPVSQNMNDSYQKGVRYRFNESSDLMFCTLTPSTGNSFKSNSEPFIGKTGQTIYLVNTKFNPISIEIEMTEHDIETVSTMLEGDQMRNLDLNMITTFDNKGNIYNQVKMGSFIDPDNGYAHDFKINNNDNIDFNENIGDVKDNL